jgi:hypothetical protein
MLGPEPSAEPLSDLRQRSVFFGSETSGDTSEKPAFKPYERDYPLQELFGKVDRLEV